MVNTLTKSSYGEKGLTWLTFPVGLCALTVIPGDDPFFLFSPLTPQYLQQLHGFQWHSSDNLHVQTRPVPWTPNSYVLSWCFFSVLWACFSDGINSSDSPVPDTSGYYCIPWLGGPARKWPVFLPSSWHTHSPKALPGARTWAGAPRHILSRVLLSVGQPLLLSPRLKLQTQI